MTLEEWITEYGHWLPNKAIKDLRSIEPTREMISAMQEDAERYEKIKELLLGADFEWGDEKETVLVFRWRAGVPLSANLDSMLDAIAARGVS